MSDEKVHERIGLRLFSEGIELILDVEKKVDDKLITMWNQYTQCPHCKKKIRIVKWIEKWKGLCFKKKLKRLKL